MDLIFNSIAPLLFFFAILVLIWIFKKYILKIRIQKLEKYSNTNLPKVCKIDILFNIVGIIGGIMFFAQLPYELALNGSHNFDLVWLFSWSLLIFIISSAFGAILSIIINIARFNRIIKIHSTKDQPKIKKATIINEENKNDYLKNILD